MRPLLLLLLLALPFATLADAPTSCPGIRAIRALPQGVFTAPLGDSDISGEWLGIGRPGALPEAFSHVLILQHDAGVTHTGVFNGCNYTMSDGSELKLRPAPAAPVSQFASIVDTTHWARDGANWLYCSGTDPRQCRFALHHAAPTR